MEAREYLGELFDDSDRIAIFLSGRDRTLQKVTSAHVAASWPFQQWLQERNREGMNIYVAMNPLNNAATHRHKEDIREITALYVDLDRGGKAGLTAILSSVRVPKPSFVLWTSPDKYQAVWRVKRFSLDRGEYYLRGLVDHFKDYADPAATDRNRVLRLPGFINQKESAHGHTVEARKLHDAIYEPSHFLVRLDLESSRGWENTSHRAQSGKDHNHTPNHETDWAEGMRRLERGESHELVKKFLEDNAAQRHKPSPKYYAEHSLTRMLSKLEHSRQQDYSRGYER